MLSVSLKSFLTSKTGLAAVAFSFRKDLPRRMPHFKKIAGSLCYLSPLSHDDAEVVARWENDLAVAIPLGDEAYTPMSLEKMREQIDGTLRDQARVCGYVAQYCAG